MENKIKVMVERETYEKKGKQYFSYYIKGLLREQPLKAGVKPPDVGGYTLLDVIFNGEMSAELVVTPFEMKTETGDVISGNTYKVVSYDEDGTVYECPVKPARVTDKAAFKMLLR